MTSILICTTIFIAFIAAAVISMMMANRNREAFEERFPPISDAEFVARCRPGTNPEVALKVRRIIADALGLEYERVHPDARLIADLDCC